MTGEYHCALDDKGRLLIPSRLRNAVGGDRIVVTRGVDQCIWLFPPVEWGKISQQLMDSASMFKSKTRLLQRRIVAPAQECELDKAGRINIPPSLRSIAGLKKDVIILGIEKYIEVWEEDVYQDYLADSESEFLEAAEELGEILSL